MPFSPRTAHGCNPRCVYPRQRPRGLERPCLSGWLKTGIRCTPAKESYSDSYLCYLNRYQDSTGYLEAIWGLDSSRG
eukprot:5702847-Prymnesium_polylepis.1